MELKSYAHAHAAKGNRRLASFLGVIGGSPVLPVLALPPGWFFFHRPCLGGVGSVQ